MCVLSRIASTPCSGRALGHVGRVLLGAEVDHVRAGLVQQRLQHEEACWWTSVEASSSFRRPSRSGHLARREDGQVLVDERQRARDHVGGRQGRPASGRLVQLPDAELPLELDRPQALEHVQELHRDSGRRRPHPPARPARPRRCVLPASTIRRANARAGPKSTAPCSRRAVCSTWRPKVWISAISSADGMRMASVMGSGCTACPVGHSSWARMSHSRYSPTTAQLRGKSRVEREGVAVDHRAQTVVVVDLVQGKHPAGALDRVGGQPADAVAEPGAEQVLHDVALQAGPAGHGRAVEEERAEPVLQVGVEQQPVFPARAQDGDGADRLGDRGDRVLPAGRFVAEVLREVADGGHTGLQRVDGVGRRGREPDHEVAHVRLDRDDLADLAPFGGGGDQGAGLGRDAVAERLGHGHAPVETDAGAVDAVALVLRRPVDVAQRFDRGGPGVHADVGMVHDGPVAPCSAPCTRPRRPRPSARRRESARGRCRRDGAAFRDQGMGVGKLGGKELPDALAERCGAHVDRSHTLSSGRDIPSRAAERCLPPKGARHCDLRIVEVPGTWTRGCRLR